MTISVRRPSNSLTFLSFPRFVRVIGSNVIEHYGAIWMIGLRHLNYFISSPLCNTYNSCNIRYLSRVNRHLGKQHLAKFVICLKLCYSLCCKSLKLCELLRSPQFHQKPKQSLSSQNPLVFSFFMVFVSVHTESPEPSTIFEQVPLTLTDG